MYNLIWWRHQRKNENRPKLRKANVNHIMSGTVQRLAKCILVLLLVATNVWNIKTVHPVEEILYSGPTWQTNRAITAIPRVTPASMASQAKEGHGWKLCPFLTLAVEASISSEWTQIGSRIIVSGSVVLYGLLGTHAIFAFIWSNLVV